MKPVYTALIVCLCILSLTRADTYAGSAEAAAQKAAQQWLSLVDRGKYDQSWETTAALFKNAITKAQWHQTIKAVRPPLGQLTSRHLTSSTHTTSLPGAPDGEYVVIQFQSSFSHKKSAVETITPMKDPDGIWRVSGYYIK